MWKVRGLFFMLLWLTLAAVAFAGTLERRSVVEVHALLSDSGQNVFLLDVRTPEEYAAGHLKGAVLYDYHSDDFERKLSQLPKEDTIVIYCATGYRSIRAARLLEKMGYAVVHMDGGIEAWKKHGYSVVK